MKMDGFTEGEVDTENPKDAQRNSSIDPPEDWQNQFEGKDVPGAFSGEPPASAMTDGGDEELAALKEEVKQLRTRHAARNREAKDPRETALVECATTAGPIAMRLRRSWSPNGYDRAASLFERGFYDHTHFFRVVPRFLVQFGISYTSDASLVNFSTTPIEDDPKREDLMPFREGYVSFAGSRPDSRTSQLFIAFEGAGGLGSSPWETPLGEVVDGMDNARKLYGGYGDIPPWGKGPQQSLIRSGGFRYIEENFSLLDKFNKCSLRRIDGDEVAEEGRDAVDDGKAQSFDHRVEANPSRAKDDPSADRRRFSPSSTFAAIVALVLALSCVSFHGKKRKRAEKRV